MDTGASGEHGPLLEVTQQQLRDVREELSQLQDRWMALEEWSEGARKKLRALGIEDGGNADSAGRSGEASSAQGGAGGAPADATVASIEALYKERISELKKQMSAAKKSSKEQQNYESHLKKAKKKIEALQAKAEATEQEASLLRERVFELQTKLTEAQALDAARAPANRSASVDSFDSEGQYQNLYKECLTALNQERDLRHEDSVRSRTQVQNLTQSLDDANEELISLRADIEVRKLREASLSSSYGAELQVAREKEVIYVLELKKAQAELQAALDQSTLQHRIKELEVELEELRLATGGELLEQEKRRQALETQVVMEKNMQVMEEVYELRERVAEYDFLREKCFFALVWLLKFDKSSQGQTCNLDATALWQQVQSSSIPPRKWDAWLAEQNVNRTSKAEKN